MVDTLLILVGWAAMSTSCSAHTCIYIEGVVLVLIVRLVVPVVAEVAVLDGLLARNRWHSVGGRFLNELHLRGRPVHRRAVLRWRLLHHSLWLLHRAFIHG